MPVENVDQGARRSTSMRRIATVVSSVPDASSAASITSRLGAPPVPMINREVNSLPAPPVDQLRTSVSTTCTAVTISTLRLR